MRVWVNYACTRIFCCLDGLARWGGLPGLLPVLGC